VSLDYSIVLNGVIVCAACKPTALAKLQTGQVVGDAAIWREKKVLVLGARATLPDRCIKCNATSDGARLKRTLYWHPPGWYVLVLANLIIYAIVAMIVRKTAKIEVGLCAEHRRARWTAIAIGWGLFIGSIAALVVGINANATWLAVLSPFLLLTGLIWGAVGGRVVSARRIDARWVRLGGAGPAFLDELPEFPREMA
jgi:hypothetical protein